MIHYHGTPVGGKVAHAAEFFIGKHALVSHARPEQLEIVGECCQSFVLDNGAFTQWKRGKAVDVEAYIQWVHEWHRHPGFDWALIPDIIEGDEKANDELIDVWRNEAPNPSVCGVPVWHLHESLTRLERLAQEWRTVALGSSGQWPVPGATTWWRRMQDVMGTVCSDTGVPKVRLHGLRMMSVEIFPYLPFASADSANAGINQGSLSRFGYYKPPTSGARAHVIASRIERYNSPPRWQGPPDFVYKTIWENP